MSVSMRSESGIPRMFVQGLVYWPLAKLIDRMREAAEYNYESNYKALADCPPAWRAYCLALQTEYRRRGEPHKLF